MGNHKSAIKRARQNEKRRARNRAGRSSLRTTLTKFDTACESGPAEATNLLNATVREIAIAAKKGLLTRQTASRKIGRLTRRIGRLS